MNKFIALLASGTVLSGCVNLTPDYVYPLGTTAPIDAASLAAGAVSVEASIKTAKSGEVLLEQSVLSSSILRLANDVEPVGNISLAVQERSLDLTKGDTFYLALNVGEQTALVACSHGRPVTWVPRLNPGASAQGKMCFELEPIEGEVDLDALNVASDTYTSDQFFFVADGAFVATGEANPYQLLSRWDPQFIYSVAPAAILEVTNAPSVDVASKPKLALRFIYTDTGSQIEPVYMTDGRPSPLEGEAISIASTDEFPKTIEYDGAKIELLALEDGVLAYRVLAGFETGRAYIMDLPE